MLSFMFLSFSQAMNLEVKQEESPVVSEKLQQDHLYNEKEDQSHVVKKRRAARCLFFFKSTRCGGARSGNR